MNAEERSSILKERARALAREGGLEETTRETLDVIEFRLGSETYALEYGFVREVQPLRDFTPLPALPPFVLGIVNLRGAIFSIVDLRVFFNIPQKGLGDLNKLIVIGDERMEFGILADDIVGVRALPRDAIQAPIPTVNGIGLEFLKGIAGAGTMVLDAERILGDERIIVRQEEEL